MAKARFIQDGNSIDYTPGADVTAGDVIVQGSLIGVAKVDIPANKLGALAVRGVFDVVKANEQQALGAALYWDADGNPYNGTAGTGRDHHVRRQHVHRLRPGGRGRDRRDRPCPVERPGRRHQYRPQRPDGRDRRPGRCGGHPRDRQRPLRPGDRRG